MNACFTSGSMPNSPNGTRPAPGGESQLRICQRELEDLAMASLFCFLFMGIDVHPWSNSRACLGSVKTFPHMHKYYTAAKDESQLFHCEFCRIPIVPFALPSMPGFSQKSNRRVCISHLDSLLVTHRLLKPIDWANVLTHITIMVSF